MKKDYRLERFSKANVAEHIASLMRDEADLFKKAEGTALDFKNTSAQAKTELGRVHYFRWQILEVLKDDVTWWGVR